VTWELNHALMFSNFKVLFLLLVILVSFWINLNCDFVFSYFENINRICSEKFCPNQTDMLRARVRTQGILETCFRLNGLTFRQVFYVATSIEVIASTL